MENTLDKLFESIAKARLLKLFLMNPDSNFTLPEIVKQTQLKRQAVKKELLKFMRLNLVKSKILAIPEIKVKKLKIKRVRRGSAASSKKISVKSKKRTVVKKHLKKTSVKSRKKFRKRK